MEPSAILSALTEADDLPRAALRAAADARAEMIPLFVGEIERWLAAPAAERAGATPLFYIFHLLGDWKATSAYRPLARFLRSPRHELDAIIGDGLTTTVHRVMAAVFDGDPRPLFDIILDPKAEEFVRSRMCETLAMVVLAGKADREAVARFLRDAFAEMKPQAECFVWNGWQSAIAMLGLDDLRPVVKKAFDRQFIDPQWLGFEHFEEDLERGLEHPGKPRHQGDLEYTLFGDTVEELSTWYCFTDSYKQDLERSRLREEEESWRAAPDEPRVNPFKGVGRNDPCPCGSGRKFKKCCLA